MATTRAMSKMMHVNTRSLATMVTRSSMPNVNIRRRVPPHVTPKRTYAKKKVRTSKIISKKSKSILAETNRPITTITTITDVKKTDTVFVEKVKDNSSILNTLPTYFNNFIQQIINTYVRNIPIPNSIRTSPISN